MRLPPGFTLVELLVVVAVMLVLAGLLVGAGQYAGQRAMVSRCKADIQAIDLALEAYRADEGGYPPLNLLAFQGKSTSPEGFLVFPGSSNALVYAPDASTAFANDWLLYYIDVNSVAFNQNSLLGTIFTNGWYNSQYIYRALAGGNKKYITFRSDQVLSASNGCAILPVPRVANVVIDPWGVPYGYNPATPVGNPGRFDLWSAGPDKLCSNSMYQCFPSWYRVPVDDDVTNWSQ